MKSKLLAVLCFAVLCVTLTLGLWPFHSPRNEVAWLKSTDGIALGDYGTVFGSGALQAAYPGHDAGGSIEMWVRPDRSNASATMMALYRPEKHLVLGLRQSLTDLELQTEVENDRGGATKTHVYVDDAFGRTLQENKPAFIAVTFGPQGSVVYLNGTPAKVIPRFRIPEGILTGRLIVGDAPRQPDSFRGQIRGLAIYEVELDRAQVARHYRTWMENGRPDITEEEHTIALYLFDERAGNAIHNRAAQREDLYIPDTYSVVDKIFLEPFWTEFDFSRGYWRGNLKNVIGFIPTGFCFCAYLMVARHVKRAVLMTVLLGALVSLIIEILQAYLPTRDSGTTDLITNALGTYVGAISYKHVHRALAEGFSRLGWLASPRA